MDNNLQNTDLSQSPYFDDYDPSKNFHRILYKPGYTVQARELNQEQSILQDQIARTGRYLFKEGAVVIPGGVSVYTQNTVSYFFDVGSAAADIANRSETLFIRNSSGLVAEIQRNVSATEEESAFFLVSYSNSGNTGSIVSFSVDDICDIYATVDGIETVYARVSVLGVGVGVWAKSVPGTYFVRGHYVEAYDDSVVVSRDDPKVNARIGFNVVESIVSVEEDQSLYSSALGFPNHKSPGADRLKISLVLSSRLTNNAEVDPEDNSFIELIRLFEGEIETDKAAAEQSELMRELARRTYEESGNYTVRPFNIDFKEHLKESESDSNGTYLSSEGGDINKFVVCALPGLGYVEGFRYENAGIVRLPASKARTTQTEINASVNTGYGSYLLVKDVFSLPNISVSDVLSLRDSANAIIGTCVLRNMRMESTNLYRMYVTNFVFNAGKNISLATKVTFQNGANNFSANLSIPSIFDASSDTMLFGLPHMVAKTLVVDNVNRTSYVVSRSFLVTTNASGVGVIGLGTNELFDTINPLEYIIADTGASNAGVVYNSTTSGLTLGGNPVGRSLTFNLGAPGANKSIKVIAPVRKQTSIAKTKTPQTVTGESVTFTNQNEVKLSKFDAYELVSVVNSDGLDVTAQFLITTGQTLSVYGLSGLRTKAGQNVTGTYQVSFKYFLHSPGDYFSVDSYVGIAREDIPKIGDISLADILDFRSSLSTGPGFVSQNNDTIRPNSAVTIDMEYYLPRCDTVYLTAGGFAYMEGVPAENYPIPQLPETAMRLYDLLIPAYTDDLSKIQKVAIENKRYTMRDIGKLDQRLSNVEYYTVLSQAETATAAYTVLDPVTGNNRFKNGFVADNFKSITISDLANPKFYAFVNFAETKVQPMSITEPTNFVFTNGTNHKENKNTYSIKRTERKAISQKYATKTINVNPYSVTAWNGVLEISPTTDYYVENVVVL